MKIYKYPLVLADRQVIQMPEGAIIRHVGEQMGALCIWAEVNPLAPLSTRRQQNAPPLIEPAPV